MRVVGRVPEPAAVATVVAAVTGGVMLLLKYLNYLLDNKSLTGCLGVKLSDAWRFGPYHEY